jgi:hypothetical protein
MALGMTHRNVETLIGRLATDTSIRRRFLEDPKGVPSDFRDQGFELTSVEHEALATLDAQAMRHSPKPSIAAFSVSSYPIRSDPPTN